MSLQPKLSLLPALAALLFSVATGASGLDAEQNASGLGVSYAGKTAVADNASVLRYNPAGLTMLEGPQFSTGVVRHQHRYRFKDRGSNPTGYAGNQAGQWQTLPNVYFSLPIVEDWSVGLGISSPYSLDLDYGDNWLGRSSVINVELDSLNFNPVVAYRVSDRLSLGFGVDYQKIRLKVRQAGGRDSDSDNAWGWDAGALVTLSPSMRLGFAYHSGMKYRFDSPSVLSAFPGVTANGRYKTPGVFSFSVWQQVSEQWEAMGDFSYTRWRSLDDYNRDSWRLAWGAAYTWDNHWKTKFGLAYDRSPISDSRRLVLLPDSHRFWFSLGAQYRFGKASALDFGYAYQWVKKPRLYQDLGASYLRGHYDASGHILGIQYSQGF